MATHISFRVSPEQHGLIADAASARGMSITNYALDTLLTEAETTTVSNTKPSSTPQAVYAALDTRLSTVETALQQATTYLREDSDASN